MARLTVNKNTNFYMRNIRGTTGLSCGCGSWIQHWRNFTKSARTRCVVLGCGAPAQVGAHVLSADGRTDRGWWIAPFCKEHNHYLNETIMTIEARAVLVAANKQYTCRGRRR